MGRDKDRRGGDRGGTGDKGRSGGAGGEGRGQGRIEGRRRRGMLGESRAHGHF